MVSTAKKEKNYSPDGSKIFFSQRGRMNNEITTIEEDVLENDPPLPPLTQRVTVNKRLPFKKGNTIAYDIAVARKAILNTELAIGLIHPVQTEEVKKLMNSTERRIVEGTTARDFTTAMTQYLQVTRNDICYDKRSNRENKSCNCLIDVMSDDVRLREVARSVTNYYNLPLQARKDLLCTRVHNIIDCKVLKQSNFQIKNKKTNQFSLKGKVFVLSNLINDSTHKPYVLCRHSFQKVYGVGHYVIDSLKNNYAESGRHLTLKHGLSNKTSNLKKSKEEALNSMKDFFESLKGDGEDYASRQVRARLGNMYLRDDENDIRLPPSWSKRIVYERWVYSNGWIDRTEGGDSSYSSTKLYTPRPYDEDLWPEGSPRIAVVCKATFLAYWREHFSHIKIAPLNKDTCGICWEYKRQMAVRDRIGREANSDNSGELLESIYETESVGGREVGSNDDESNCEEATVRNDSNFTSNNNKSDDSTNISHSDNSILENTIVPLYSNLIDPLLFMHVTSPTLDTHITVADSNNLLELHSIQKHTNPNLVTTGIREEDDMITWYNNVQAFMDQRKYVKQKALEAKTDLETNITWPERRFTFCGDYCQNMDLPHFGSEQPGETYYYSPLNISCFGLVDHSTEVLSAYVYSEAIGRKGGNNVSSLIYKKLKDDGILDLAKDQGPGKEFTLIFDNCAGQNKNRMVLKFAQYLVDCDVFKRVEVIFLVMGHTKNICDRRFKDLKKSFHKRNVYAFNQLIKVLGKGSNGDEKSKYVDVHTIEKKDFYDWDTFFNQFYKKSIKGVSKYHCFLYANSQDGYLHKKTTITSSEEDKEKLIKLKKSATKEDRNVWVSALKATFPEEESHPGLSEIKQVELYLKWRHVLPDEFQDIMCPKPSDTVLDKIKNQKREKAKTKLAQKKQSTGA